MENKTLTISDILDAKDVEHKRVHVPEWGGDVIMRQLTGADRDKIDESMHSRQRKDGTMSFENGRAEVLSLVLVNDAGERLFKTADDVKALGNKSNIVITRLFDQVQTQNGLTDAAVEELGKA